MARIRSIHPKLFTDESYMALGHEAARALPGIWTECDDNGVFEWKPVTLKARILPAHNVDMIAILAELTENGFVVQFEQGGKMYGAVRNFLKFQRPKKPTVLYPLPKEIALYVGRSPTKEEPPPPKREAVPHRFPTAPEINLQMEEGGGKREEINSEANASGAAAPSVDLLETPLWMLKPPDGDWKKLLFNQGLDWLAKQVDSTPKAQRSFVGQCLQLAGDDAGRVFSVFANCQTGNRGDPKSWIVAQLGGKAANAPPSMAEIENKIANARF
jgi:hypothetical protein